MKITSLLAVASSLSLIQARQSLDIEERSLADAGLSCLEWGFISPVVGIFCYFTAGAEDQSAEQIAAAEQNITDAALVVAATVKSAGNSAENLIKFDLTHNPVSVGYNYAQTAIQNGTSAANAGLRKTGQDYIDVSVGFGKQSLNQGIQLFDLADWTDVNYCLIRGAASLVLPTTSIATSKKTRDVPLPHQNDGVSLANRCIQDKYDKITAPPRFNLTGSNQAIGSTISDIAALLIPVGEEADAVHAVFGRPADLAFPGEDASRIYKWVDNAATPTAEHFASPEEAQALADKLGEDPTWQEENCGACSPLVATARKRSVTGRRGLLQARGNILGICCKAPQVLESDLELDATEAGSSDPPATADELAAAEKNIVGPPRQLTARDLFGSADATAALNDFRADLQGVGTSALKWPAGLSDIISSKDLFSDLRKIFEDSNSDAFKALNVKPSAAGKNRLTFASPDIAGADSASLPKGLADFDNAAQKLGVMATRKTSSTGLRLSFVSPVIEYFYTPAGPEDVFNLAFHTDQNVLHFGAQDVDGIVFEDLSSAAKSTYRVEPQDNTFVALKGKQYKRYIGAEGGDPTPHAVFGPEIVKNGRVSLIISVGIE